MTDPRRALPSVGLLLESPLLRPLLERAPRSLVADAVRAAVDAARRLPANAPVDDGAWVLAVERELAGRERASLRPVLNGTGVVLHTNLGRAPLAAPALAAMSRAAEGFSNLEYDLARGERGSRYVHCVELLRELTGAADALVVNNCAAALVLALDTVAAGREVLVSRGELIEIGGSFRIPDIMAKSGAVLVEVGTTNRTHADDYHRSVGPRTGAIVKVHRSNFTVGGFVAEASVPELLPIARAAGVPLIHDFGSGLMLSLEPWGLAGEPTAAEVVREGASLVLMSGDKLLGGPQAGIILGDTDLVARIARNSLTRALRVDKLTLAALSATLALYRDPERARHDIPALAMLTATLDEVRARAAALQRRLAGAGVACVVVDSDASVGGGAFPTARIPSAAVALEGVADAIARRLRDVDLPVIARIADGRLLVDLRSVPAAHDDALATSILAASAAA